MNPLTTQLTRLFERLSQQQTDIDSIAGVLAQASAAGGTIFIAAFGEMKAVAAAAIYSSEPLTAAVEWSPSSVVTSTDRVWILSPNKEGDELAGRLSDAGIPFAFVSSQSDERELADAFLLLDGQEDSLMKDDSEPVLVPHAMAALYIYYAVKLRIDALLAE
ncbi:hypothetical protein A1A1_06252 [Planococcus antarcticus DSM 14505]|uniref:DUF2529 domain-containing protein n=1 Tax=Planococcus antarcticus DSM 14505 TaxID=1185653 RepID=A0A1C7DFN0_9BACL|nr:DUF2529 family protein [Planococcus antarcticus]ANU10033.1 hypothetical protein BBH88_06830 [Planococcus antarcticus DSM 14505]EIM07382.1 hypothetical protein A1A1_06252 [Planococcus antarcticus DSM 14505]